MDDPHHLIHKAVGWMLREAGKRDEAALVAFLEAHRAAHAADDAALRDRAADRPSSGPPSWPRA